MIGTKANKKEHAIPTWSLLVNKEKKDHTLTCTEFTL